MKKIVLTLIITVSFFSSVNYIFAENTEDVNLISDSSTDINKDKLKIEVSTGLTLESGFGNNASSGNELVFYIQKLLKYTSLFISISAVLSIIYIYVMLIFTEDQNKIKDYRNILFYVIFGFIFYGFIAGSVYVWIIKQGEKYSKPYYNEIIKESLNDSVTPTPKLLREK